MLKWERQKTLQKVDQKDTARVGGKCRQILDVKQIFFLKRKQVKKSSMFLELKCGTDQIKFD